MDQKVYVPSREMPTLEPADFMLTDGVLVREIISAQGATAAIEYFTTTYPGYLADGYRVWVLVARQG